MSRELFAGIGKPVVFGHRGHSEAAPENTMAAFRLCVQHGVPAVELDVHLCKTGELVVIHDHKLNRLAGVDGTVEESTFEYLRSLDVGSHKDARFASERIPLLSELFAECGDKLFYDVELKVHGKADTGLAATTWETIKAFKLEHRCMVSSFNPFAVRYFNRASAKSIPTAVIYCESDDVPRILQHGWGRHLAQATVLKPDHRQVDAAMVAKMRTAKGYPISTWTVNDRTECRRLLEVGIDGIIGNDPLMLLEEVAKHAQR